MGDGSRMGLLQPPLAITCGGGGGGVAAAAANTTWVRGGCIGRGSFGTVSLAHDKSSGRVFAVKSVKLGSSASSPAASSPVSTAVEALENEIRILRSLSSPYVVSYVGEETTREAGAEVYRNLLMEYVTGGTVAGLAARRLEKGAAMEDPAVRSYARCVARALEYLHGVGVVHGDVKGRNVLAGSAPYEAKLADFGAARRIHAAAAAAAGGWGDHPRGTPLWMAPEVVRGEATSPASDVWSFGCTVIEMATGRPPWSECGHQDAGHLLLRIALGDELPEFPAQLSKSGRDFLDKCLRRNPAERWSCERLLRHPFLAEPAEQSPRSAFEWANFGSDWETDEEENSSPHTTIIHAFPSSTSVDDLSGRVRVGDLASKKEAAWEDTEGWEMVRPVDLSIPPCPAGDEAGETTAASAAEDRGEETSPESADCGGRGRQDRGGDASGTSEGRQTDATRCPSRSSRRSGACYCRCGRWRRSIGPRWRHKDGGSSTGASLSVRRWGRCSAFFGWCVKLVPSFFVTLLLRDGNKSNLLLVISRGIFTYLILYSCVSPIPVPL